MMCVLCMLVISPAPFGQPSTNYSQSTCIMRWHTLLGMMAYIIVVQSCEVESKAVNWTWLPNILSPE